PSLPACSLTVPLVSLPSPLTLSCMNRLLLRAPQFADADPMGRKGHARPSRNRAIPDRSGNASVSTQRRKHALLAFEDVSGDLAQPVGQVRPQLEGLGLDRGPIALVRGAPPREEVVGLRLVVGHLHAEHLQQLARRVHRTPIPSVARRVVRVHWLPPWLASVCRSWRLRPERRRRMLHAMDTTMTGAEAITAVLPKGYRAREFRDGDREPWVDERNAQVHELQRGTADEWREWEAIDPPKNLLRVSVDAPD